MSWISRFGRNGAALQESDRGRALPEEKDYAKGERIRMLFSDWDEESHTMLVMLVVWMLVIFGLAIFQDPSPTSINWWNI